MNAQSAPAFVQIIIEKYPKPKGMDVDGYDRYDVSPNDIIREVTPVGK